MDEHNYQIDATEGHDEILDVPANGYEEGQEYKFYVLWIQRGVDSIAHTTECGCIFSQRWEDDKPEETRITPS